MHTTLEYAYSSRSMHNTLILTTRSIHTICIESMHTYAYDVVGVRYELV